MRIFFLSERWDAYVSSRVTVSLLIPVSKRERPLVVPPEVNLSLDSWRGSGSSARELGLATFEKSLMGSVAFCIALAFNLNFSSLLIALGLAGAAAALDILSKYWPGFCGLLCEEGIGSVRRCRSSTQTNGEAAGSRCRKLESPTSLIWLRRCLDLRES